VSRRVNITVALHAARVAFQACSIDHSDISPFRINELRPVRNSVAQNLPSRIFDLKCPVAFARSVCFSETSGAVGPAGL
jgi:hypothetical protein